MVDAKRDRVQIDISQKRREKLDVLREYFGVDSDVEMFIRLLEKVYHVVEDEGIQLIRYQDADEADIIVLPKSWLLK